MRDYLLLILADVLLAVSFGMTKYFQRRVGNGIRGIIVKSFLGALAGAVFFFFINGMKLEFEWFSLIMAASYTLCCCFYSLIGYKIMSYDRYGLYMLFLMLGGMTLPYVYGLIFYHERPSVIGYIALAMIITAMILSAEFKGSKDSPKEDTRKTPWYLYLLCVAVFLLNGIVSCAAKIHQVGGFTAETLETFDHISPNALTMYAQIITFLFFLILYPMKKDPDEPKYYVIHRPFRDGFINFLIIIGSTIIGAVCGMIQLSCASRIPATLIYPVVSGGSIVFNTLVSACFFKEKYPVRYWVGTGLCLVATVLFIWS